MPQIILHRTEKSELPMPEPLSILLWKTFRAARFCPAPTAPFHTGTGRFQPDPVQFDQRLRSNV